MYVCLFCNAMLHIQISACVRTTPFTRCVRVCSYVAMLTRRMNTLEFMLAGAPQVLRIVQQLTQQHVLIVATEPNARRRRGWRTPKVKVHTVSNGIIATVCMPHARDTS